MPTNHGFDEFIGNLYHLNAEEEPEHPDYPSDPKFRKKFGPRGVIKSTADGRLEDTGPLSRKRMETIDEEVTAAALDFMERAVDADKPFFLWYNTTRMHVFTHLKPESEGFTGLGVYPDGMVEHDGMIGQLLDKLDALGINENTVVMYTTDNGAEKFTWPDGGTAPFRGEKNTNWEGGYRAPLLVNWPGVIEAGSRSNGLMSHMDWLPTVAAALGDADPKEQLKTKVLFGEDNMPVHLDGYNMLPYWSGEVDESPRDEFFYFSDDGSLVGMRYKRWKAVFAEQRAHSFEVWADLFVQLRVPRIFDLYTDPFEEAEHESIYYHDWWFRHVFLLVPAQAYVGQFLSTFQQYPPRQKPASFSIDQVLESMQNAATQ